MSKELTFTDSHPFNLNREIVWSFTQAMTGTDNTFSTFLTQTSAISSKIADVEFDQTHIFISNNGGVVDTVALSSLNTSFVRVSSSPLEQVMRFRFTNTNKISIDFKRYGEFIELYSTPIDIVIDPELNVYCGYSFTSTLSSTLFFKNFHVWGSPLSSTYTTNIFTPLTSEIITQYTTISGISASRIL
jgi:hypothetical protein